MRNKLSLQVLILRNGRLVKDKMNNDFIFSSLLSRDLKNLILLAFYFKKDSDEGFTKNEFWASKF